MYIVYTCSHACTCKHWSTGCLLSAWFECTNSVYAAFCIGLTLIMDATVQNLHPVLTYSTLPMQEAVCSLFCKVEGLSWRTCFVCFATSWWLQGLCSPSGPSPDHSKLGSLPGSEVQHIYHLLWWFDNKHVWWCKIFKKKLLTHREQCRDACPDVLHSKSRIESKAHLSKSVYLF